MHISCSLATQKARPQSLRGGEARLQRAPGTQGGRGLWPSVITSGGSADAEADSQKGPASQSSPESLIDSRIGK